MLFHGIYIGAMVVLLVLWYLYWFCGICIGGMVFILLSWYFY